MRLSIPLLCLLFLVACEGVGGLKPIDGRAFLSSLEGPKVPSVEDSQLETAHNQEKLGNYKAAEQLYRQILDNKPGNPQALLGLAESYRRMGDNDRAIPIYNELLQKDPAFIAASEGKALALLSKGDFETPIPLLETVLKADPKRWKSLNGMGILFTTRNMQPEAQQYFREALKHSPSNVSVMNNMGLSQALDRRTDDAIATLNQAASLTQPESAERKRVDLNLALVYAIAGRLENAKSIAAQYFSGATLSNNMGLYAHLAKDDQLSKAYLNMALSQSKTFYDKAWENLQAISSSSGEKLPMPVVKTPAPQETPAPPPDQTLKLPEPKKAPDPQPAPAKAPEAAAKETPAKKAKEAVDERILGIINSSGEESDDIVSPSPIP